MSIYGNHGLFFLSPSWANLWSINETILSKIVILSYFRFSAKNEIGSGAYGKVYKGKRFDQDIAVKVMKKEKFQKNHPEFERNFEIYLTDINILHRFPAKNLLTLMAISFTNDVSTDPCLIYEYMKNGSVFDRLNLRNGTAPLTW